jgi:hypothetical protein
MLRQPIPVGNGPFCHTTMPDVYLKAFCLPPQLDAEAQQPYSYDYVMRVSFQRWQGCGCGSTPGGAFTPFCYSNGASLGKGRRLLFS